MADGQIILNQVKEALFGRDRTFTIKGGGSRIGLIGPSEINLNVAKTVITQISGCEDFSESVREGARVIFKVIDIDTETRKHEVFQFLNSLIQQDATPLKDNLPIPVQVNVEPVVQDSLPSTINDSTLPEISIVEDLERSYIDFGKTLYTFEQFIRKIINDPHLLDSMENITDNGLLNILQFSNEHPDFVSRVNERLEYFRSRSDTFPETYLAIKMKLLIEKGVKSNTPEVRTFFTALEESTAANLMTKGELETRRKEIDGSLFMSQVKGILREANVIIGDSDTLVIGNHTINLKDIFPYISGPKIQRLKAFSPLIETAQKGSWQDTDLRSLAKMPDISKGIFDIHVDDNLTLKEILVASIPETLYPSYLEYSFDKDGFHGTGILEFFEELLRDDSVRLKQVKEKSNVQSSNPGVLEDLNLKIYSEVALKRIVDFTHAHGNFLQLIIERLLAYKKRCKRHWWNNLSRYLLLAIIESAKQYDSTRAFAKELETACNDNSLLYMEAKKKK